jgi:DNA replication protein DnaC
MNRLCALPLLVIDELEKLKESEAKQNWLSYVIGKRYNDMKPLVLIINAHLMDNCVSAQKPCPQCLEYHLTPDILSRITEDGIVMNFTAEDYRRKLGQAFCGQKAAELAKA